MHGAVAGTLLLSAVAIVGTVHVIARVADETAVPIREHLAYNTGFERGLGGQGISGTLSLLYRIEGVADRLHAGYADGMRHRDSETAATDASAHRPVADTTHTLSDGRTWRNVGILHRSDFYDVRASRHCADAVAGSDAVIAEYGDYFDDLRSFASEQGKVAGSLRETRIRAEVVDWPLRLTVASTFALSVMAITLLAILAWAPICRAGRWVRRIGSAVGAHICTLPGMPALLHAARTGARGIRLHMRVWLRPVVRVTCQIATEATAGVVRLIPWRRTQAAASKPIRARPAPLSRPELAAIVVATCAIYAVAIVVPEVAKVYKTCHRQEPRQESPADAAGTRAGIDRWTKQYVYDFAEASEVDSRSMYREVRRYLDAHPECRHLLVVSGASHAADFERYWAADQRPRAD